MLKSVVLSWKLIIYLGFTVTVKYDNIYMQHEQTKQENPVKTKQNVQKGVLTSFYNSWNSSLAFKTLKHRAKYSIRPVIDILAAQLLTAKKIIFHKNLTDNKEH